MKYFGELHLSRPEDCLFSFLFFKNFHINRQLFQTYLISFVVRNKKMEIFLT